MRKWLNKEKIIQNIETYIQEQEKETGKTPVEILKERAIYTELKVELLNKLLNIIGMLDILLLILLALLLLKIKGF